MRFLPVEAEAIRQPPLIPVEYGLEPLLPASGALPHHDRPLSKKRECLLELFVTIYFDNHTHSHSPVG